MKRILVLALPAIMLVGFWGYAFEFTYFRALDLNVHKTLTLTHYVKSAGGVIAFMIVALLVFGLLKKFFTKRVHEDELKAIDQQLKATTFAREIIGARLAFFLSLVFWAAVYFGPRLGVTNDLGFMYLYLTLVNLQFFFASFFLSPPYSRPAVIAAFTLSVAVCFSAGGYGSARIAISKQGVVRDDGIVRVELVAGKYVPQANPVGFKIPWLDKISSILGS